MNIAHIHEGHRKSLLQWVNWCQAIDPFIILLGLDINEVTMFKEEVAAVVYIAEHYKSFANSFIVYNKGAMKKRMDVLVNNCFKSINYTHDIGNILGIEEQLIAQHIQFTEPELYVYCKN